MDLKDQSTKNLLDFKKILDQLGVYFWLDCGTLLGAVRDNDFCEDDENDVDLCSRIEDMSRVSVIIEMAEDIGFKLYMHWPTQIAMKRGDCKIDLFFNEYDWVRDIYWTILYKGNAIDKYVVVPGKHYKGVGGIVKFKGEVFNTPAYCTEYLTLRYGDWKTKVHRSNYSCYNKDQNKLVVNKLFN